MKSNGIEVRSNGCEVHRKEWPCLMGSGKARRSYHVKIKQSDGTRVDSKNGPWDRIYNARVDADRGATGANSE